MTYLYNIYNSMPMFEHADVQMGIANELVRSYAPQELGGQNYFWTSPVTS